MGVPPYGCKDFSDGRECCELGFGEAEGGADVCWLQAHCPESWNAVQAMGFAIPVDEDQLITPVVPRWRKPGLPESLQPVGGREFRRFRP